MQTVRLNGIIFQTVPVRESDLIVHVLTAESGRVHAIARGARKSRRRFIGGLDLFDCGVFELTSRSLEAELSDLRGFERTEVWLGLREDLHSFALGSIVLDVIGGLSHPGVTEAGRLFGPTVEALRHINAEHHQQAKLRSVCALTFSILCESGYDPLSAQVLTPETKQILSGFRSEANAMAGELERSAMRRCLKELLNFTEHILSHPLRSRRQFPKDLFDDLL